MPGHVDYALARRAVLRDFRRGALTRLDVCDAHPELLRAGRNVGEPAPHDCPICGSERVRFVSYVYGDTLKQANGRCITYEGELDKLDASFDELVGVLRAARHAPQLGLLDHLVRPRPIPGLGRHVDAPDEGELLVREGAVLADALGHLVRLRSTCRREPWVPRTVEVRR